MAGPSTMNSMAAASVALGCSTKPPRATSPPVSTADQAMPKTICAIRNAAQWPRTASWPGMVALLRASSQL